MKIAMENVKEWKSVLTVFVHFSYSIPLLLKRWQSTQLSDQSIFLSLWCPSQWKYKTNAGADVWWGQSPASPRSQQSTNLLHLPPPHLMRFSIITTFDISIMVQVNTAYLAELEAEKERLEASQQEENTSSTSSHLLRLLENGRCLEKKQR